MYIVVVVVVVTTVFLSLPPFVVLIFSFPSVCKCTKNQSISQTEDLSILGAGIQ